MSETVLTIIELDNYPEKVVARASWLAKLMNCDLELLLCDPTTSFLSEVFIISSEVRDLAEDIEEAQRKALLDLAETARSSGLMVTAHTSHERPAADAIISRAMELDPMFVVKGTHYHSPAERATFADTDWQLMKKLDFPLWFVKPVEWKDEPLIVAAVDPTHEKDREARLDRRIVETALSLATACTGRVELVHTYQRLVEIGSRAMKTFKPVKLPIDELDRKIRDEHRKALDAFAAETGVAEEQVHQLPGRAHELLPTFARTHGASLMVMGALSRGGITRRYIGNTAARVLDHLPCDILVVPAAAD
jgi:universal stress protein E